MSKFDLQQKNNERSRDIVPTGLCHSKHFIKDDIMIQRRKRVAWWWVFFVGSIFGSFRGTFLAISTEEITGERRSVQEYETRAHQLSQAVEVPAARRLPN